MQALTIDEMSSIEFDIIEIFDLEKLVQVTDYIFRNGAIRLQILQERTA